MNIVLFGGESAGVRLFRELQRTDYSVVAVVTTPEAAANAGGSLWGLAQDSAVPIWSARESCEPGFTEALSKLGCDVLLCVRFPYIVNAATLAVPALGAFNLHTGPLPQYAGLNVCSWAIFNGESEHAVTLHEMTADIDAGRIVSACVFPIGERETGASLTAKCVRHGVPLFVELLDTLSQAPMQKTWVEQDFSQRQYFGKEIPNGGCVRWSESADVIDRFVRAADFYPFPSPWGHPRTRFKGREIRIIKVSRTHRESNEAPGLVGPREDDAVLVSCADEWLRVELLAVDGVALDAAAVLTPGEALVE